MGYKYPAPLSAQGRIWIGRRPLRIISAELLVVGDVKYTLSTPSLAIK